MSRNFEILKKANRTSELFGPESVELAAAIDVYPLPLNGPPTAEAGRSLDVLPSLPLRQNLTGVPRSRLKLPDRPEDWHQLLGYLFPPQSSALCYSLGVCSTKPGESVAFIATLGERLRGFADSSVLLVEATFQRSCLAQIFGVPAAPGLHEMLLDRAVQGSDCLRKTCFEHLWVLPAGGAKNRGDFGDLAESFRRVYETLTGQFNRLIFALPPITEKQDALFPFSLPDAVVLLVRPNSLAVRDLHRAMRRLIDAKANLVGTILNELEARPSDYGGSLYGKIRSFVSGWGLK
ncbi:MAG: hypothetical protein HY236_11645 [Acidobacteria bacterium]|nr:hypothetical protein [Acidobacteriota bacterium]